MVIAMDKVMDSDTLVLPQEWQLAASNIWAMDSEEEIPELPQRGQGSDTLGHFVDTGIESKEITIQFQV